ncbi:rhodopsin, GQ-coupled-like [Dreissena polymorpha]|uniref:rhodopsin, GQ-coupled-like n=1 Tax=Dreissena polymorpha TaxID=45954 RepID=UPI0022648F42|nr:rhodopsin, GQ-coupled-like [Dreissena polymorpha]
MALGNIPMLVISSFWGHWVFGDAACRTYAFIGSASSFVSINTLAVISVDRCLVIVRTIPGHNNMTRRTFILIIASIWTYAILWAAGPLFGFGNYILEGTNTSCTFDFLTRTSIVRAYVVSIFMAHFIIPIGVIAASYSLIFRAISKFKHEFREATKVFGENELPLHMRKSDKGYSHEAKTARVTLTVILVFCVSWTPYATVAMIGEFGDLSKITRLAAGIPCLFAKCSTIVNPIVYALVHPKFRSKLINFGACTQTEEDRRQEQYRRTVVHFRSRKQSSV